MADLFGEEEKDPKKVKAAVARSKSLTAEDRSAIARKAALTKHAKGMPKAIAEGELKVSVSPRPPTVAWRFP